MGDSLHSRSYYAPIAFVAGAAVAIGIKDIIYPEVKKRLSERNSGDSALQKDGQLLVRPGPPPIVEGIEGCIGNTHLVRIKSLSEATGCEILAKAEVGSLS